MKIEITINHEPVFRVREKDLRQYARTLFANQKIGAIPNLLQMREVIPGIVTRARFVNQAAHEGEESKSLICGIDGPKGEDRHLFEVDGTTGRAIRPLSVAADDSYVYLEVPRKPRMLYRIWGKKDSGTAIYAVRKDIANILYTLNFLSP